MSLSLKIALGLAAGVLTGLFFGEYCAFLQIPGDAFIGLLQMTVLPYIVIALVVNIGRLTPEIGRQLVGKALGFLAVLIGLGALTLVLVPLCFPEWTSASFFSSALVEPAEPINFLALYIPSNPFASLANNVVPAVVLFCILLGAALIQIPNKEGVMRGLDVIGQGLNQVNKLVIRATPIGVFALAAATAGTIRPEQVGRLQAYLLTYTVVVALLGFWVLPQLMSSMTPFQYRRLLSISGATLLTIFATGKIIVVLPQLIDNVQQLFREQKLDSSQSEQTAELMMPLAYPFPNLGTYAIMMFVPFAAWFVGNELTLSDWGVFLGAGTLSSFVAPVTSIPFLLDLLKIPIDMFQLFVISTVYTDRVRVVLGAMHLLVLTVLVTASISGHLQIRKRQLVRAGVVTAILAFVAILGIRTYLNYFFKNSYTADKAFVQMHIPRDPVPVQLFRDDRPPPRTPEAGVSRVDLIRTTRVMRVGYIRDRLPFAFVNASGDIVGFDIDMAHQLARRLGARLEVVRIELSELSEALDTGLVDIVMSGVMPNLDLLERAEFSASYLDQTAAFLVPDERRGAFSTFRSLEALKLPKIAVLRSQDYLARSLERFLPGAETVLIDTPRPYFRKQVEGADALLYTAEAGSAWTLIYPDFSAVVPQPGVVRLPTAYPLPKGDERWRRTVDQWIELAVKDGSINRLFGYWIYGEGAARPEPRWSLIRDVLGWVR